MNIESYFLAFALLGARWVLWLLVLLSIGAMAVAFERLWFLRRRRVELGVLLGDISACFARRDYRALERKYRGSSALETYVAITGVRYALHGRARADEAMSSVVSQLRPRYERFLLILGTLGNNAPFIGLFGTVLGVIAAFRDLSAGHGGSSEAVMGGISEALVATGVGLLVAIPAVVTYNYLSRRVRLVLANVESVSHAVLAEIPDSRQDGQDPQYAPYPQYPQYAAHHVAPPASPAWGGR